MTTVFRLFLLFVGLFGFLVCVKYIRDGVAVHGVGLTAYVKRSENPVRFWFSVAVPFFGSTVIVAVSFLSLAGII